MTQTTQSEGYPLLFLWVLFQIVLLVLLAKFGVSWLKPLPWPFAVAILFGIPCLEYYACKAIGLVAGASDEFARSGACWITVVLFLIILLPSASPLDVVLPSLVLIASLTLRYFLHLSEAD